MVFSSILLFFGSLLVGAVITLIIQCYFLRKYFYHQECVTVETKTKSEPFQLPKFVLDVIKTDSLPIKESCMSLNLLLQFLFNELRDTEKVRMWFWNKLSLEFEELITRTTVGRMFSGIQIKDINLGTQFPIIKNISIQNVNLNKDHQHIDTLDLKLDLQYQGGFQLMINANMLLGKAAFLSIKVAELTGEGRLQFTRLPYSHWSFTFYQEPKLRLEVESQFQGRPLPQITALITSQIRKSLKKKHTLPHYKLRYKPFFTKFDENTHVEAVNINKIQITLHRVSRLNQLLAPVNKEVYCVAGLGSVPWIDVLQQGNNHYMLLDLVIIKKYSQPLGLVFKQEFVDDKNSMCVVLDTVTVNSPADEAEACKEDIIVSIDGKKVTALNQAPKFIKSSAIQFTMRVERRINNCRIDCNEAVMKRVNSDSESSHGSTPPNSAPGTPAKRSKSNSPEHTTQTTPAKQSLILDDTRVCALRLLNTKLYTNHQIISMMEMFSMTVSPSDKYLNICIKTDKEVLVGYVNIPLSSLVSCVDSLKRSELKPPDSFSPPLSRSNKLSAHNGFSSQLCYGDVLLTVQHVVKHDTVPSTLTKTDSLDTCVVQPGVAGVTSLTTDVSSRPGSAERKHDFVRTHFQNSTQCEFCGKKIWLKDAMQCKECSMACHKKCIAKCQTSATCGSPRPGSSNLAAVVCSATAATAGVNLVDTDTADSSPSRGTDDQSGNSDDPARRKSIQPEIVTTTCGDEEKTPTHQNSARKGLSSLLASVASAGRGLKRVGSANNLTLPTNSNQLSQQCKSLPPSPQQTPSPSRKASLPMELSEDINEALQALLQQGSDQGDMMDYAKASGKTLYDNLDLPQRKEKINRMIEKLNTALDNEAVTRSSLVKEESASRDQSSKTKTAFLIGKCDEKTQTLAVLLLHFFAGLQHIQDLEEQERDVLNESVDVRTTE